MKQFLITVAGVLVGLVLFIFIVPFVLISALSAAFSNSRHEEAAAPAATVLQLDLREQLTDAPSAVSFPFGGERTSVVEAVRALEAAATDPRVKGLYVRANTSGMYPAHAEELNAAFADFKKAGKWVIASIQNEGVESSIAGYATIADADEIWLHGASHVQPMGIVAEQTFFGDTMKKFHLTAEVEAREEYKSYLNFLTETGFTAADREETSSMMNSIYDRMINLIAASRTKQGLTPQSTKEAIEATPFSSEEALKRHLIDKLGTPDEAAEAAITRAGGEDKAGFVEIGDYNYKKSAGGQKIALVIGEGEITTGHGEVSPFGGDPAMASDDVADAILQAAANKEVKAIVFRVSSPGGSAVGSDQIWRAIEMAKAKGKKIVVSMGAVAASGGYYVSAGADEIVAWPSTITGSIGVIAGKIVTGDAMEHYLAAKTDTIQLGSPAAGMFSPNHQLTNAERAAFKASVDRTYQDFMGVVAKGRHLTPDEVHVVAKGRVWTGEQALPRKLVNTMGGLEVAIERAKALSGIKADQKVSLEVYPRPKSPFQAIEDMFGVNAQDARVAATLAGVLGDERVSSALKAAMQERGGEARAERKISVR